MTGIGFFKQRCTPLGDSIENLESKIGFKLPKFYKKFIKCFELGQDKFVGLKAKNLDNQFSWAGPLHYVINEKDIDISCDWFFTLEEIVQDFEGMQYEDEFTKDGTIRIASIGIGGGLFLGVREDNADKIYAVGWDWPESPIFMAEDIFEAVSYVRLIEDSYYLKQLGISSYDQLIRKWGDDHWTVINSDV